VLLGSTSGSRSIPSSLRSSPGSAIPTSATLTTLAEGRLLLARDLAGLTLETSIHITAITSLRVTILELVTALLEPSCATKSMLLTVRLTIVGLSSTALTSVRGVAHATIATSISVRATESTVSTSVAATTVKTATVVSKTAARIRITANRGAMRSSYIGSLFTLGARDNIVFDIFALSQALKATIIVNGSVMDKNLIRRSTFGALGRNDKAESFLAVKELDSAGSAGCGGYRHVYNER